MSYILIFFISFNINGALVNVLLTRWIRVANKAFLQCYIRLSLVYTVADNLISHVSCEEVIFVEKRCAPGL